MSKKPKPPKLPNTVTRRARRCFMPAEIHAVYAYLADVQARLGLSYKYTEQMLNDHISALITLKARGSTLDEAMGTLDPVRLGDFYLSERKDWYPLDHAAKVYPLSMKLKTMPVFRLSGYFRNPVEPSVMQMALSYTIRRFPYFATTIKCGFFWHYIDSAMRRYALRPESKRPCAVMRLGAVTSPTLRVVYYQNRVSVEFFHVLTDGAGGEVFLRTLMREYLLLMGESVPPFEGALDVEAPPKPEEWQDGFVLGDKCSDARGFAGKPAIQLRGLIAYDRPCRVLHYNLSVAELKAQAKQKGVKLTTLTLGYLFLALKDACPQRKTRRRIQVQLPVNMRQYYPIGTLRNFSMYCSIALSPSEITTLDDILPKIDAQVKKGAAKASLDEMMQLSRRMVRSLRFVPLVVKRPIVQLVYGALSDAIITTTFSNLGAISAPEEFTKHVDKMDFVLGPPIQNRVNCAMCSFGDKAVLTITKTTTLTLFEDSLYSRLREGGFEPYMEGTQ